MAATETELLKKIWTLPIVCENRTTAENVFFSLMVPRVRYSVTPTGL